LKNKTDLEVANALTSIFKECRKPELVWSDKGKQFYNQLVKSLVALYSTENEEESCMLERWNRTMKHIVFKYFTANNTYRYIDVIQDIVDRCNNTKHTSIKMTPVLASMPENESKVYMTLYYDIIHDRSPRPVPRFAVGDTVRITKKQLIFNKSYHPLWAEELFEITAIQYTNPITYEIKDMNGKERYRVRSTSKNCRSHIKIHSVLRRLLELKVISCL
jgi:hypothetical protein